MPLPAGDSRRKRFHCVVHEGCASRTTSKSGPNPKSIADARKTEDMKLSIVRALELRVAGEDVSMTSPALREIRSAPPAVTSAICASLSGSFRQRSFSHFITSRRISPEALLEKVMAMRLRSLFFGILPERRNWT